MCVHEAGQLTFNVSVCFVLIQMVAIMGHIIMVNGNNKCPDLKTLYSTFSDAWQSLKF